MPLRYACLAFLARAIDTEDCASSALADTDVERYHKDGYVIIRNLFSAAEADVLRRAIETDPLVASNDMPMVDANGARSKLTLWNYAGNDTFGYFARGRRWVNAARRLIGSPIYHFHTKVMLKEPRVGGTCRVRAGRRVACADAHHPGLRGPVRVAGPCTKLTAIDRHCVAGHEVDRERTLDMKVDVVEKPTGSFSVGAGFSNLENFVFTANVQKNNFLGLGYTLASAANISGA